MTRPDLRLLLASPAFKSFLVRCGRRDGASSAGISARTSAASVADQTRVCNHDWRRAARHPRIVLPQALIAPARSRGAIAPQLARRVDYADFGPRKLRPVRPTCIQLTVAETSQAVEHTVGI